MAGENWRPKLSELVKRAFDICVSVIALILLAPVFLLVALAIKHDSPGPVIYRGQRTGRGGKPFNILKFRTMYEDPKSYAGPEVTAHDDPRVTPLGHWLRNTKLNEIPQFWNVLKGEMSLVGPRPEDPSIAKTWPRKVREEILSVRPGITSPATVQYHDEEAMLFTRNVIHEYLEGLVPDKTRLDQLYVRYRSFWLDLDVLLWTGIILLPKIHTPPEKMLFIGPISQLMRRYLSWFSIDLIVNWAAFSCSAILWRMIGPLNHGWQHILLAAFGYTFIFSTIKAAYGANRIAWSKASLSDGLDLLPAWAISTITALVIAKLTNIFLLRVILLSAAFSLIGFFLVRFRLRLVRMFLKRLVRLGHSKSLTNERVLIVGSGTSAQHLAWLLGHPTLITKFRLVGIVDDDLPDQGMRVYGASIVGTRSELCQLVEKYDAGLVMIADPNYSLEDCRAVVEMCRQHSTQVVFIPDIFGTLSVLADPEKLQVPITRDLIEQGNYRCLNCLTNYARINEHHKPEESSQPSQPMRVSTSDASD